MSQFPDRLSRWAAEAKSLGMKYGDYVAKYHPQNSVPPPTVPKYTYIKTCPECGQVFGAFRMQKAYCSPACRRRQAKRRQRAARAARNAKKHEEETFSA